MPFFSVIIPVYNVAPYLRKAVDSALRQTFTGDYEIILIDDGSTDGCAEICDEYGAKDTRLKVIHKTNGGQSSARNAGLKIATGDYIVFLDSDDWLEDDALETFYGQLLAMPVDVLRFTVRLVYSDGKTKKLPLPSFSLNKKIPTEEVLISHDLGQSVCDIVWARKLLEETNIKFKDGIFHEDELFVAELECKAKTVDFVDYAGYNYFIRKNSTAQNKNISHLQKWMHDMCVVCECLLEIRAQYINSGDALRAEALYRRCRWRNFILFRNLIWEPFESSFRRRIIKRLQKNKLYPLPQWTFQDGYALYRFFTVLHFPLAFFLFLKQLIQLRGKIRSKFFRASTTTA